METAAICAKQGLTPPTDSREETESPPQSVTYARAACTECARRKQRCNREWPCNHCKKRKVGNQCRYNHDASVGGGKPSPPTQDGRKKRGRSEEEGQSEIDNVGDAVDYGGDGFEALGYSTAHLFAGLTTRNEATPRKPLPKQYFKDAESCPQLARALQVLPPRPHTDHLVQNFLSNVNFHYYIIYGPDFLEEYQAWWKDRAAHKPLSIQWTCLLIMICACSCQYTDKELQRRLEEDLAESVQRLTERYHGAARELYSIISVGHGHLLNVQVLLHSCYWYKGEIRFVECWHVLASAIREAQELGIHQEQLAGPLPEFEREMRRRVWCILDTWDWQISSLLGRPMIIDRSDCEIGLPSLSLEDFDPSPLLHMKLQSQIIGKMAGTFGLPKYVVTPEDVQKYQRMLEIWMQSFPACYDFDRPDFSRDKKQPWMKLHRHYLHTMSNSMMLDPIRAYLAKDMSRQSPQDELQIRRDGIKYCLRLMKALHGFFGHVYPRDSKFHFVIFCVFDTASILCSTIIHDQDDSAPKKDEMLEAIDGALGMLKQLSDVIDNAKTSYQVLGRIAARARVAAGRLETSGQAKRTRFTSVFDTAPAAMTNTPSSDRTDGSVPTMPQDSNANFYTQPNAMAFQPLPATAAKEQNGHHNEFQVEQVSPPMGYPITEPYLMPNFMPQRAYDPNAPAVYGMDPVMQHTTILNDHDVIPSYPDGGAMNGQGLPGSADVSHVDVSNITEEELGQLAAMWQYQTLNLDFINPQP